MDEFIALFSGNRPESFWLYFGIMTVVALFGLYQSNRGHIVVFANYTDVLCTFLALALPVGILFALRERNMSQTAQAVIVLIPVLFVAKATFSYNRGVFGFLLSLFTKFFLVIVYIAALVFVVVMLLSGGRKKYARKSGHAARQAGKAIAGAAGVTGIFALLVKLGLHSSGFVPISYYLGGVFPEDAGEKQD